jgi:hypothetical protein
MKPIKFTGDLSKILVVSRDDQPIKLEKALYGTFVGARNTPTLRQKLRTLREVWKWL